MAQAPAPTLTQDVLREGLILSRTPDPPVMAIFGASGHLAAVSGDRVGASGTPGRGAGGKRVDLESRWGPDLTAAKGQTHAIGSVFAEPQVYRIDHYLGKETVQDVLVFRFAIGIFEPIW